MRIRIALLALLATVTMAAEPVVAKPDVRESLDTVEHAMSDRLSTNDVLSTMYVLGAARRLSRRLRRGLHVEVNLVPLGDVSPFRSRIATTETPAERPQAPAAGSLKEKAREILVEAAKR